MLSLPVTVLEAFLDTVVLWKQLILFSLAFKFVMQDQCRVGLALICPHC